MPAAFGCLPTTTRPNLRAPRADAVDSARESPILGAMEPTTETPHEWTAREAREAFRTSLVASIPAWYSPWGHLLFPSLFGLGIIAAMVGLLHGLRSLELLTVPVVYLVSNAVEWRIHKYMLHRRFPFFTTLYDRHTPQHHRVFVSDDMEMRSTREFRLVLIPFYGIVGIVLLDAPFAAAIWHFGYRNVACLFLATSAFYVLSYELLHLCYHLPATHPIGRSAIIRRLRRHHAIHHAPSLMQRWNFNVTVPLWDVVRRTVYHGELPPGVDPDGETRPARQPV